jgi:hypothetical protein
MLSAQPPGRWQLWLSGAADHRPRFRRLRLAISAVDRNRCRRVVAYAVGVEPRARSASSCMVRGVVTRMVEKRSSARRVLASGAGREATVSQPG